MEVDAAFGLIARAIDEGRAAHGYLLVGDLVGQCDRLVELILRKLFPEAVDQIAAKSHPDVAYLYPEGAKRIITIDSMRERIVEPLAATAFSGGWKVGVIVGADRMETPSANAFLKSLEEPPPKTLFLLLADQPEGLLPTIVSRSQRVDLPLSEGLLEGEDLESVLEAFADRDAGRLVEIFDALKKSAEKSDVAQVRKRFFRTLMREVRMLMHSGRIMRHLAFRNVEEVEDAYRRSANSMGDEMVLNYLMDRLVFP